MHLSSLQPITELHRLVMISYLSDGAGVLNGASSGVSHKLPRPCPAYSSFPGRPPLAQARAPATLLVLVAMHAPMPRSHRSRSPSPADRIIQKGAASQVPRQCLPSFLDGQAPALFRIAIGGSIKGGQKRG